MASLLDDAPATATPAAADRLRATMAAVRVMFTWFGTRRSLTTEQKAQAADAFGAEGSFLSAGKKLIDTSHPAFKAATSIRSQATGFWRSITVPFPEPGVRLIRRDDVSMFEVKMSTSSSSRRSGSCGVSSRTHPLGEPAVGVVLVLPDGAGQQPASVGIGLDDLRQAVALVVGDRRKVRLPAAAVLPIFHT